MASKNNKKNQKKDDPKNKKSFGKRFKSFFADIKAELKRVTWPDKKKLKSNTGIVIGIIILSVLMIFVFDTAISAILNATGFYSYDSKTPDTEITETIGENAETDNTADQTEDTAEGSEATE